MKKEVIRGGSSIFSFFTLVIQPEDTHKAKNPKLEPWGKANSAANSEEFFTFRQSEDAPAKKVNMMTSPDMANLANPKNYQV